MDWIGRIQEKTQPSPTEPQPETATTSRRAGLPEASGRASSTSAAAATSWQLPAAIHQALQDRCSGRKSGERVFSLGRWQAETGDEWLSRRCEGWMSIYLSVCLCWRPLGLVVSRHCQCWEETLSGTNNIDVATKCVCSWVKLKQSQFEF